ncbi:hypothetical protein DL764_009490 [Monosporascus ibericus]|uniref:PWI domain-containing protein n=1 Tax=Monosporascus ibericus TaxID=155417 RepID=A0A4Q4SX52_9PEZI|nr:hypothetical protein DL764_009490 [Monosporascus ibericus]
MASSVDAKLLRATKFPPEFNQKVDMQKVNIQVMKKWIASRISEILGSEDDVVIELCFNLIEGTRFPDIKSMQIQLTGFLDKDTAPFCKELWNLCLSAQTSPQGVPKELLEAKKLELIQEKIDADKAAEEARIRRENQERRDRELADIRDRDRERRDRGFRGGRGDTWRGGRRGGDRAYDDRGRGFGRGRGRAVVGVGTIPGGVVRPPAPPRQILEAPSHRLGRALGQVVVRSAVAAGEVVGQSARLAIDLATEILASGIDRLAAAEITSGQVGFPATKKAETLDFAKLLKISGPGWSTVCPSSILVVFSVADAQSKATTSSRAH